MESADPWVMYIVLRLDLDWPRGALVAQAAHAATAIAVHPAVQGHEYFSAANLDHMRKVVVGAPDEASLRAVASELDAASVIHKLWMEQPENIPTCIATAPIRKSTAKTLSLLRKLKLFS